MEAQRPEKVAPPLLSIVEAGPWLQGLMWLVATVLRAEIGSQRTGAEMVGSRVGAADSDSVAGWALYLSAGL